jgi:ParB family chromosome partitioning protein
MTRKALGRGLKALIPDTKAASGRELLELNVDQIHPGRYQPRHNIDLDGIQELARSIKAIGIIQPILVKPGDGSTYELIAGERRWRAAQEAGLEKVPVIIQNAGEAETLELALIENIQREDLNPIEAALGYQQLIDKFSLTQEEVSSRVGKNRSSITNSLRLLKLPSQIQEDVSLGRLSMGHARAILSLHGREKQLQARKTIIARDLSVRETESLVNKLGNPSASKPPKKKDKKDLFISDLEAKIRRALGTKVAIRPGGKGGTIAIQYYSVAELERVTGHITGETLP